MVWLRRRKWILCDPVFTTNQIIDYCLSFNKPHLLKHHFYLDKEVCFLNLYRFLVVLVLHSALFAFIASLLLSGSLYRLLLDLLELLFEKFKAVAQAHSVVLAHLQQIVVQSPSGAHEEGIKLYEQADVSAKIQTVLQVR